MMMTMLLTRWPMTFSGDVRSWCLDVMLGEPQPFREGLVSEMLRCWWWFCCLYRMVMMMMARMIKLMEEILRAPAKTKMMQSPNELMHRRIRQRNFHFHSKHFHLHSLHSHNPSIVRPWLVIIILLMNFLFLLL